MSSHTETQTTACGINLKRGVRVAHYRFTELTGTVVAGWGINSREIMVEWDRGGDRVDGYTADELVII